MRPRDGLAELEDPIEIAATWGDLFFSGKTRELDWLTMRTCTIDLSGTASEADALDREGLWSCSEALAEAFEDVAWRVGRIEQREHEVRLDASLEACHTGPLDLSFRGGPTYEATGRLVRLPLQRFCWTIAHKRVHTFEVKRGPGLGMDLLARELELTRSPVEADKQPADPDPAGRPTIEDLIEEARASKRVRDAGGR